MARQHSDRSPRRVPGPRESRLVDVLAAAASARGVTIATAESCTGGLVGAALTARPGSSKWYVGGAVAYADAAKSELLGVSPRLIERAGAVSGEVAAAMARGARERLGADVAVSVTGIAGPGGGVPGKPVGTVWLGVDAPFGAAATHHRFPGDRAAVRDAAVRAALLLLVAWVGAVPVTGSAGANRRDDEGRPS